MQPTFYTTYVSDIATGIPISWDEEVYDGMWELTKKGRESEQKVTDSALANSATDQANRSAQYAATQPEIAQLDSAPGSLSPAAQARLAADQRKIQDTYNNAKSVGLQRIAQHGMGTLTGENSSMQNSLERGQASDELAAHENAQLMTREDQLAALNARMGLQTTYNPNQALNTAATSAYDQAQMGSTLGDIGKGLSTAASIGGAVVGAGGLANLPGNFIHGK